jgi:iron complex outermembrane receptor protein
MNAIGRRMLLCGFAGTAMSLTGTGWAQDTRAESGGGLEEIIVTAQRRSERLQDVPVTVTVFGAEQVRAARIQAVQDVVSRTTGLDFDAYPASEPRLAIRGVGSSDRGAAGDPSSAVFIDEIYYGRPAAIAFDAFDLQRIEVLKGPQGTLFGRNVVGGAINIVTATPALDAFDAGAEASFGNYNRRDFAAMVNAPFADGTAAVRLSGALHRHDGYVDRETTAGAKLGELDDQDSYSVRAQFAMEPTDALRLHFTVDTTTDRANGPGNRPIALDIANGGSLIPVFTSRINRTRDFNRAEIDGLQDRDTWGARAKLEWDLSFATLSYLGSYRDLEYQSYYDFDGTNSGAVHIHGGNTENSKLISHEVQLRSLPSSPTNWVAGVYNYRADTVRDNLTDLFGGGVGGTFQEDIIADSQTDSIAAYGDITVPISDRLNVLGGARYTRDEKDYRVQGLGDPVIFLSENYDVPVSDSWDAVTWRIGTDYHITPELMVYATVSRGFKAGGFQDNAATAASAATPFDPEYAINYEIGERGEFFDGRVTWNNTLYVMKYTDMQVGSCTGPGSCSTTNAGSATVQGYETELNWLVGGGFALHAAYAYSDATFDEFIEVIDDSPLTFADRSGNRITRNPEHKVVVSPNYTYEFGNAASLEFAVDYSYTSKIFDDNSNQPPETRDPSTIYDARALFRSADNHWVFSLWGKNLTDEQTITFQGTFSGVTFGSYNAPRTYGVSVRWDH